jgi:glutamate-1-semialdehyde 2,1-aminomutase
VKPLTGPATDIVTCADRVTDQFWRTKTERSRTRFSNAKKHLVGGVASALHKAADEDFPIYISHGHGSKIFDIDGNAYIDYLGSFGPMILGYCPAPINEAVIEQLKMGSHFAAPTESLNVLSEKLVEIIPCADKVSYQMSGTEAVMVALRYARAFTGKDKIIKFEGHYHGWSDEVLVSFGANAESQLGPRDKPWKFPGSAGQPERCADDVIVLPWNDPDILARTINRRADEIAAVIMEPIMCNCEPVFPRPGYLEAVRTLTRDKDIVLIFDEIITGFRLSLGGAQEHFGVIPDLSTFGKAAAAGFPIAGVVGRNDIMEAGVNPVGTFNANPVSVAACLATIRELEDPTVYEHMARITDELITGVSRLGEDNGVDLYCGGEGPIWQIAFGIDAPMQDYRDNFKADTAAYRRFRRHGMARGIRFHPSRGRCYTSAVHTDEDVDKTLEVIWELMGLL